METTDAIVKRGPGSSGLGECHARSTHASFLSRVRRRRGIRPDATSKSRLSGSCPGCRRRSNSGRSRCGTHDERWGGLSIGRRRRRLATCPMILFHDAAEPQPVVHSRREEKRKWQKRICREPEYVSPPRLIRSLISFSSIFLSVLLSLQPGSRVKRTLYRMRALRAHPTE
jgi:hypothetical protein